MSKTLKIVRNTDVIKHRNKEQNIMNEVCMFSIQIHEKDENRISILLPIKLYKYKQYTYIIKMKERN